MLIKYCSGVYIKEKDVGLSRGTDWREKKYVYRAVLGKTEG